MSWVSTYVRSSVGSKHLMAVTGACLVLFVLVHMTANLMVFAGPDVLNAYGVKLRSFGSLLWVARFGLFVLAATHVATGLRLWNLNRAARPVPYRSYATKTTTPWARSMAFSGIMLLVFLFYHLMHLTWGIVVPEAARLVDEQGRHDVYSMVVAGFQNPIIAISYVIAMVMLSMHLAHGGSSVFQSLGLKHPNYDCILNKVGPVVGALVAVGNCSMPIAILAGWIPCAGGAE